MLLNRVGQASGAQTVTGLAGASSVHQQMSRRRRRPHRNGRALATNNHLGHHTTLRHCFSLETLVRPVLVPGSVSRWGITGLASLLSWRPSAQLPAPRSTRPHTLKHTHSHVRTQVSTGDRKTATQHTTPRRHPGERTGRRQRPRCGDSLAG
ncbi:hypothetical protein E2C01_075191 [Portunus trituberculatus]|uniref:Uncharacterized protein n=1 Tax=Portunus trituberculatus TaxID=210409 RepID=A0A5B7IIH5_PORTR|nr:hypothetical protein [Portunus trituberculatus]